MGRGQVKFLPGHSVDLRFQLAPALAKLQRERSQQVLIHPDAGQFHPRQDQHQGHLHFREEPPHAFFTHAWEQAVSKAEREVGIFAGVARRLGHRDLSEVLLCAIGHRFVRQHAVLQVFPGEVGEVVALVGVEQVRSQHGVSGQVARPQPILGEHHDVIFRVLADQGEPGIFQHCP